MDLTRVYPHVTSECVATREEVLTDSARDCLGTFGQVSSQVSRQSRFESESLVTS